MQLGSKIFLQENPEGLHPYREPGSPGAITDVIHNLGGLNFVLVSWHQSLGFTLGVVSHRQGRTNVLHCLNSKHFLILLGWQRRLQLSRLRSLRGGFAGPPSGPAALRCSPPEIRRGRGSPHELPEDPFGHTPSTRS